MDNKIKFNDMADCNYRLKNMYDGVYGYFNKDLTDKKAKELIGKHSAGLALFAEYPDKPTEASQEVKAKQPEPSAEELEIAAGEERKKKAIAEIVGWSSTRIADTRKLYSIDSNLKGKALHEEIYKHTSKL